MRLKVKKILLLVMQRIERITVIRSTGNHSGIIGAEMGGWDEHGEAICGTSMQHLLSETRVTGDTSYYGYRSSQGMLYR